MAASMLDASSLTLVVVSAPGSCASPPGESEVEQSALASLGLVFKHEVTLPDRPASVFSVSASDSILNDLLRDGLKVRGVVMGAVVENLASK